MTSNCGIWGGWTPEMCKRYYGDDCKYPDCMPEPCMITTKPFPGTGGIAYTYRDTFAFVLNVSLPIIGALSSLKPVAQNGWSRFRHYAQQLRPSNPKEMGKSALKAALITAAIAVPACTLAASFGAPIATAAGCGTLYLTNYSSDLKEKTVDLFRKRPEESEEEARRRIKKNIGKTVVASSLIGGLASYAAYVLSDIGSTTSHKTVLKGQSDPVVFGEYTVVALGHLGLCAIRYRNEQKSAAVYHFFNSLISLAFPIAYFQMKEPFRLHHSWTGQALQLMPGNCLKLIGASLSLDSLNYAVTFPGYMDLKKDAFGNICQTVHTYGFDNLLISREDVILSISIGSGLEFIGYFLQKQLHPDRRFLSLAS